MDRNTNGQPENGNAILPDTNRKENSAGGLFEMALHHRKIILATMILTMTVAFIYLLSATPIYTSAAKIYAEQTGPKMISDYEGFMTGSKNYLYTQKELIVSTPIISEAAGKPQIKNMKTFKGIDNAVAYIKNSLQVSVGKKDDIITVSFDSPYPKEAAAVINSVLDSYIAYHSTHKRSTVLEVLKILQKEKIKRDGELSDQVKEMLEFTKKNGIITFSNNNDGQVVIQRLAKISEALTQAQLETISSKANYEATSNMKDDPLKIKQMAMAQPNPIVSLFSRDKEIELESQIRKLEVEIADLKILYTAYHPAVLTAQQKLDLAKEQLKEYNNTFAESYIEIQKQRYLISQQTEEQLSKSLDIQQKEAQEAGSKNAEYTVLCSEMKRTERLCEILDERIKQLNVDEDTGALNINILEVARVPDSPSKPQKAKVMTMAFVLGLLLSAGLVILREQFDCRLRSAEEISDYLSVPILGIIPTIAPDLINANTLLEKYTVVKNTLIKTRQVVTSAIFRKQTGQETRATAGGHRHTKHKFTLHRHEENITGSVPESSTVAEEAYQHTVKGTAAAGSGIRTEQGSKSRPSVNDADRAAKDKLYRQRGQEVFLKPKSIASEAYKTIRTAIFFGVPAGQAKTILVTSPMPGEGKSTLASNLALAIAQAGQKTIILDCDFRKSVQHNIFGVDGKRGISNVITGNMTLNEAIQAGPVENLHILTSGTDVPNPSELLNSTAFEKLLNELCQKYDRVLIDSPPVLPVADSHILGATCDISILVLRAEKTTRKAGQAARDILMSVGSHLLGAVVNSVASKHGGYGYYNRYGYGYGYGYGNEYGYGNRKEKSATQTADKMEKAYT